MQRIRLSPGLVKLVRFQQYRPKSLSIHTCILRILGILNLQDPRPRGVLAPQVRRHEVPVVEALAGIVAWPLGQQVGACAHGRGEEDGQVAPPGMRDGDAGVDVL